MNPCTYWCKFIIRRSPIMTKYREIIRLTSLGLSQRNIMRSLGVAQKTVVKVQRRARELNLEWPLDESMTDKALETLMYSQFCYYIQKDEEKRRATMHINRKPGEQVEVDWAGDPAKIIDPDTGEITNA